MNKKVKLAIILVLIACAAAVTASAVYLHGITMPLLDSRGTIGSKEQHLIIFATTLASVVVIPVFILTFGIAWRYRESNTKAKYTPDWDVNWIAETVWWLVPTILIVILSVVTWNSSHDLDPYKPLASNNKPVVVQVVALNWKWLFIYPEQKIATVNYLQIPVNTPVNFQITSDGVMNSFWIPQLGGQVYAMAGMTTQLHLMANQNGNYKGVSANISGKGFAGMHFVTHATSKSDFDTWVKSSQHSKDSLTMASYTSLTKPSENNPVHFYSLSDQDLYNNVVMNFMMPKSTPQTEGHDTKNNSMDSMTHMQGMDM